MKICTTCGTDNDEDLDICGVCGTPLFASAVVADESDAASDEADDLAESAPLATSPSDNNSMDDLAVDDPDEASDEGLIAISEDGSYEEGEEDVQEELEVSGGMDSLMRAQALLMGKPTLLEEELDTASVDETEAELLRYQESIQIEAGPDKPEPLAPLEEEVAEVEEEEPDAEEGVPALEEDPEIPSFEDDEEELRSVEVIPVAKPEPDDPLEGFGEAADELGDGGPESIVASLLEETIAEDSVITRLDDAHDPVSIDDGKPGTPQIVKREVKRSGPPILLILIVLAMLGAAAAGAVYFFVIK